MQHPSFYTLWSLGDLVHFVDCVLSRSRGSNVLEHPIFETSSEADQVDRGQSLGAKKYNSFTPLRSLRFL